VAGEPAVVVLRPDGTYVDVNAAALRIFGVTREAFLASKPDDWSLRDPNATTEGFREEWEATGRPDIAGETTIVRRNGQHRRVRFVITRRDDGNFAAVLEPLPDPRRSAVPAVGAKARGPRPSASRADPERTVIFTAGSVLAEWRAAERRLEAVPADSPEWQATRAQIETLREQYHRLFDARR